MATIALGTLGALVGGPVGGALGALLGRQVDSSVFGSRSNEGPRLDELSITTSSYGSPLAKHYGRMRTAGTIIWATDLREDRETSGGGKGQPGTTSYSYSTSFAVVVASRPIENIGRIWADGVLLRGAAGDLKVSGALRIYKGHGNQPVDPLIAASIGPGCPAFRGLAYVVFEDLQLEDFGNRIPALSFEILADTNGFSLGDIVEPLIEQSSVSHPLNGLSGFSYEGGPLVNTISAIDGFYPLVTTSNANGVTLTPANFGYSSPVILPEAIPALDDDSFGGGSGSRLQRKAALARSAGAIRYYDTARDYQIGVQRPVGRADLAGIAIADFPGALSPDNARGLANQAYWYGRSLQETLNWRVADLDPALAPGALVNAPGIAGDWVITGWEWRENGVELDMVRAPIIANLSAGGESGTALLPADDPALPTWLRAFELPWDGIGPANNSRIYVAVSAAEPTWSGAALFADNAGPLIPLGPSGRAQAVMGNLLGPLSGSATILFESASFVDVEVYSQAMRFTSTDLTGLANGQNRLLVGDEIIQFAAATQISARQWRLQGLLRGRGGYESAAAAGHETGAPATLIDSNLVALDLAQPALPTIDAVAAIGRGDADPVKATVSNRGAGLRPLTPVHARTSIGADGLLRLCWTRRARGAWTWLNGIETPVIEAAETYRVSIGDTAAPAIAWDVEQPEITFSAEQLAGHSGKPVWVQQGGQASYSHPLLLAILP